MANPNISAVIAPADKLTIIANANGIRTLLPFLANLSPDARKKLRKVATKREGLVESIYSAVINNTAAIPSDFSIPEFTKDENLDDDLKDIRDVLASLTEAVDDTILLLGNERIREAEVALGHLETAARIDAALNSTVEQIKTAYAGQGSRPPLPVIAIPGNGSVTVQKVVVKKRLTNKGNTILQINKLDSVDPNTLIICDPGTAVVIPVGYNNITVKNMSPTVEGSFTVKTR